MIRSCLPLFVGLSALLAACNNPGAAGTAQQRGPLPSILEKAVLTFAPNVPPPLTRGASAVVEVDLEASRQVQAVAPDATFEYWTFNGHTPGPFIRVRVGDTLHLKLTDAEKSGMPHNVDFHAVGGPGGGALIDTATPDAPVNAWFRLTTPGLFLYHCGSAPMMDHIANGMYGLILVEPAGGLPKVDREFYVMQSELYAVPKGDGSNRLVYSHEQGLHEAPRYVFFNGMAGSMIGDTMLKAKTGEKIRFYVGNAGPNHASSFHVIGNIMDVYREGGMVDPPSHGIQTTLIPAGAAAAVEFKIDVPGSYMFVDHSAFRVEKGAAGMIEVTGPPRPDIFLSEDEAATCTNCLAHP